MLNRPIAFVLLALALSSAHAAPPRIAAGEGGAYLITTDHSLMVWGDYNEAPSDNRTPPEVTRPKPYPNLSGVIGISAGSGHTLALKEDGSVWSWGYNGEGQLGNGSVKDGTEPTPARVRGVTDVAAVVAGYRHSLALGRDGSVWAWGNNWSGQLGDGSSKAHRAEPAKIEGLSGVVALAAGMFHSLALKDDGSVWAWGNNEDGQLGIGTRRDQARPVQIAGLAHVKAIAANYHGAMALKDDGTVWAWGGDRDSKHPSTKPVRVAELADIAAISSAGWYNLALARDGSVWAWGTIASGEEDEPDMSQAKPTRLKELSDISEIAAGLWNSLALRKDGTVFAWGRNYNGALGDGTTTSRASPARVVFGDSK